MSTIIDGVPYLPAEAAAAALGTTPMKVLILLKEKKLAGHCSAGTWYISEGSLAHYRKEEPHPVSSRCRTGCGGSGCGAH